MKRFKLLFLYMVSFCCHYLGPDRLYSFFCSPRLVILTFHRLGFTPDPLMLSVSHSRFAQISSFLREKNLLVSLDTGLARLHEGGSILSYVLTFDDGYADNVVLAEAAANGIPSTIYVATSYVGKPVIWPFRLIYCIYNSKTDTIDLSKVGIGTLRLCSLEEKARAVAGLNDWLKQFPASELEEKVDAVCLACGISELPVSERMLDWEELKVLHRAGVTIGAHTRHHAILTKIPSNLCKGELEGSCKDIKNALFNKINVHFAYPNGTEKDFSVEIKKQVEEVGFSSAVTTVFGMNRKKTDIFALRRIPVCETSFLSPFGTFSRCRFLSETSGLPALVKEFVNKLKSKF